MDFNNNRFWMYAGGTLMLLFTSLFMLGMLSGCAENAKPLDSSWDRNCQKHYSERPKVFDECKKLIEETIPETPSSSARSDDTQNTQKVREASHSQNTQKTRVF